MGTPVADYLVDGVIGGVVAVVGFLPLVMIQKNLRLWKVQERVPVKGHYRE